MNRKWKAHANAARQVITDIREALGAATVAGKQKLDGPTGTQWELDAKAWLEDSTGFLVIDARQYSSPLRQEARAVIAWRLQDAGTDGVAASLLPPQQEAPAIATTASIEHILLTDDSTAENYMAEYLSRRFQDIAAGSNV